MTSNKKVLIYIKKMFDDWSPKKSKAIPSVKTKQNQNDIANVQKNRV